MSGTNGAGKSTFARALAERLRAEDVRVGVVEPLKANTRLVRRFSGLPSPDRQTWLARERWLLDYLTLRLVRSAEKQIKPALAAGEWVVADRWLVDHQINQAFFGGSFSTLEPVLDRLPAPDVQIWLRTPATVALERARASGAGRFGTDPEFLAYAAAEYRHLLGDGEIVVDGTADLAESATAVARELLARKEVRP